MRDGLPREAVLLFVVGSRPEPLHFGA